MRTYDSFKLKKLKQKISGRTFHWIQPVNDLNMIWSHFIGSTYWPQGYVCRHENTFFMDVQMVEQGVLGVHCDSGSVKVSAGSAVVIPAGNENVRLEALSEGGVRKKHFSLYGRLCSLALNPGPLDKIAILQEFPDEKFLREFETLLSLAEAQEPSSRQEYMVQCFKMLMLLLEQAAVKDLPRELTTAKAFIDNNFTGDITLEDICSSVPCSKTLLQNLFRKHLNATPWKYLIAQRMKYAEKLLREKNLPIKTVSAMCGYHNPLYFSNVFKQYAGVSPKGIKGQIQYMTEE